MPVQDQRVNAHSLVHTPCVISASDDVAKYNTRSLRHSLFLLTGAGTNDPTLMLRIWKFCSWTNNVGGRHPTSHLPLAGTMVLEVVHTESLVISHQVEEQ